MAPPDNTDDPTADGDAPPPRQTVATGATLAIGDAPDQTVKHLLDAATRAELERWFGLPSFQQLADKGEAPPRTEDPGVAATKERRAQAIANVDPAMLEAHRQRVESIETLLKFVQTIDVQIDPATVARIDLKLAERGYAVGEPREVEIPEQLRDDLAECTPQAILRDLHRPELYFNKTFEIVDMAAEQRLDVVAVVAEAMATSWALPPLEKPAAVEARALLAELRGDRFRDIAHFLPNLPNRRVTEP